MNYKNPLPPPSVIIPVINDATKLDPQDVKSVVVGLLAGILFLIEIACAVVGYGLWSLR